MKTAYHAASEYDHWQSEDPVDVPGLPGWGMKWVTGHSAHRKGVLEFTNHMTHHAYIDDPRKKWTTNAKAAAAAQASAQGPSDKLGVLPGTSSGVHAEHPTWTCLPKESTLRGEGAFVDETGAVVGTLGSGDRVVPNTTHDAAKVSGLRESMHCSLRPLLTCCS